MLLAAVLVLSACSGTSTTGPRPGAASEAGAVQSDPGAPNVALEPLVEGLREPLDAVTGPDGRLYVAERAGRVMVVDVSDDGGALLQERPYLDLSDRVATGAERGLLGIEFAADGEWFFAHYTDRDGASTVSAWARPGAARPDTSDERILLSVPQPFGNHNGGDLAVGPDGHLWIGLGDGGGAGDPQGNGQDPSTLLGAILRIEPAPDTPDGYTIPPANPFVDGAGGAPEVWAYGLRNPWRFSLDPDAQQLWIGDVGQGAVEEIDRVGTDRAGANFGWAALEGDEPFAGDPPDDAVAPVYTYDHGEGQSVTGGRVAVAPEPLRGRYVFGDFTSGFVRALDPATPGTAVELPVAVPGLVGFGELADGTLLAVSINGVIHRFTNGDGA